MTIYLLTAEPPRANQQIKEIQAKLLAIMPELRTIGNLKDIAAEISGKPDTRSVVIYVSPTLLESSIENFINIATRYRQRVFFVLISNEISGADYKRLVRSGGADWVSARGSFEEIPELIGKQNLPAVIAPQTEIKPTVISFLPSLGGVGNTTIALEVALRIKLARATRDWRICYIDFDFQTSHVCDYLDIDARFQVHEILERPERLDEHLFGLFVSHHACGLDVFAAPRNKLDTCQINAAVLDPFMEMILERYDYLVLDLPVSWFDWTGPTLEGSDAIIITGINTIPCLRQMKATLDAVKTQVPSSQIAMVMNRVTHNLLRGVERRGHVESVFPNENLFYAGEDANAVERINTGTPAALGRDDRAKQFAKLLSFCTSVRQKPRLETAT